MKHLFQLWVLYERHWEMEGFYKTQEEATKHLDRIEERITAAHVQREGMNVRQVYDWHIVKVEVVDDE